MISVTILNYYVDIGLFHIRFGRWISDGVMVFAVEVARRWQA